MNYLLQAIDSFDLNFRKMSSFYGKLSTSSEKASLKWLKGIICPEAQNKLQIVWAFQKPIECIFESTQKMSQQFHPYFMKALLKTKMKN